MDLLTLLSPMSALLVSVGVLIGIVFGAIPGMTATMAVAVCLPLTYAMNLSQGLALLLGLYLFVVARGLYIATQAQDTYSRLLAGSLSLTFFVYVFVNTGMVIGLLPVVGLPLPLISYGGTSMVTLMAGFGILMSIHTHRKLLSP